METKYRALQVLNGDEHTYSEIVVPMLLERIPDSIRLTITQGKQYLEWTLKHFLDSLLTEVELRADNNLTAQWAGSNDHRKGPHKASALFATKGGDRRCAFCLGGHPLEDCKKVQDVKEKNRFGKKTTIQRTWWMNCWTQDLCSLFTWFSHTHTLGQAVTSDNAYVVNEKKMALQQMIDRKSSFFTSGEVNPCKASVIYHSIGYL